MRWLRKHRQIIETVIARLVETYGLQRINAHSELGMLARLAAKMPISALRPWSHGNSNENKPSVN